ncbi:hypothetical protein CEUSTIGMA_g6500.t1 [Chlamydomonas eustigma]|uniref:Queuine tRNA-ribosyltransferase accessory subunit 2 n=1 Tax=Chlamydomonas eustigma TaxID=1157962 RepID=A0A250X8G5_9CHLO|nr:hypothetical protein CEUSTIGMA_g6500.t1 [Chlamydomonas eustigma]|eukprot:GAX79060.1 hypothetical protein CEUSTIGMA_g6500.t1 [Chlamydomonas eustigma]
MLITNVSQQPSPSFTLTAKSGKARCGTLNTVFGGPVLTPASLMYTRRGVTPNLVPDMLRRLDPNPTAFQVDVLHFLSHPSPDIIKAQGQGARGFLSMNGAALVLASSRDPTLYPFGGKPSNDKALYCTTNTGGMQVSPEMYMSVVEALQPDLFVTMADEITNDASKKKSKTSVDRTLKWLDECLELQTNLGHGKEQPSHEEASVTESASVDQTRRSSPPCSFVGLPLASITGGGSVAERERCAREAGKREHKVAGFSLSGFGTGEGPGEERQVLISTVLSQLPESKLRFMSGISSPSEVLDAVAEGIDLFDCSFTTAATSGGYALSFPITRQQQEEQLQQQRMDDGCGEWQAEARIESDHLDSSSAGTAEDDHEEGLKKQLPTSLASALSEPNSTSNTTTALSALAVQRIQAAASEASQGGDLSKVNLWSTTHRLDKGPLLKGCTCFTCKKHSRAYVQHLLQVHEMLAEVLLDMHNVHHYHSFMQQIRASIQEGSFEEYRQWFKESAAAAAAASACSSGMTTVLADSKENVGTRVMAGDNNNVSSTVATTATTNVQAAAIDDTAITSPGNTADELLTLAIAAERPAASATSLIDAGAARQSPAVITYSSASTTEMSHNQQEQVQETNKRARLNDS